MIAGLMTRAMNRLKPVKKKPSQTPPSPFLLLVCLLCGHYIQEFDLAQVITPTGYPFVESSLDFFERFASFFSMSSHGGARAGAGAPTAAEKRKWSASKGENPFTIAGAKAAKQDKFPSGAWTCSECTFEHTECCDAAAMCCMCNKKRLTDVELQALGVIHDGTEGDQEGSSAGGGTAAESARPCRFQLVSSTGDPLMHIGQAIIQVPQGEAGALQLAQMFSDLISENTEAMKKAMVGQRYLTQQLFATQLAEVERAKAEIEEQRKQLEASQKRLEGRDSLGQDLSEFSSWLAHSPNGDCFCLVCSEHGKQATSSALVLNSKWNSSSAAFF